MSLIKIGQIDLVSPSLENAHKICSRYELTSFDGDTDGPFEGEWDGLNDGERVGFSSISK